MTDQKEVPIATFGRVKEVPLPTGSKMFRGEPFFAKAGCTYAIRVSNNAVEMFEQIKEAEKK